MVQLIKIDRLGPRIEGMLYKRRFEEVWSLLDDVRREQQSFVARIDFRLAERKEVIRGGRSSFTCEILQGVAQCKVL